MRFVFIILFLSIHYFGFNQHLKPIDTLINDRSVIGVFENDQLIFTIERDSIQEALTPNQILANSIYYEAWEVEQTPQLSESSFIAIITYDGTYYILDKNGKVQNKNYFNDIRVISHKKDFIFVGLESKLDEYPSYITTNYNTNLFQIIQLDGRVSNMKYKYLTFESNLFQFAFQQGSLFYHSYSEFPPFNTIKRDRFFKTMDISNSLAIVTNDKDECAAFDLKNEQFLIPFGKKKDLKLLFSNNRITCFKSGSDILDKNGKTLLSNFERLVQQGYDGYYWAYRPKVDSIAYVHRAIDGKLVFIRTLINPYYPNENGIYYLKDNKRGICNKEYKDIIPPIYDILFKRGDFFVGYRNDLKVIDFFNDKFDKIKNIENITYLKDFDKYHKWENPNLYFKKDNKIEFLQNDATLSKLSLKSMYSYLKDYNATYCIYKTEQSKTVIYSPENILLFDGICDSVLDYNRYKNPESNSHYTNQLIIQNKGKFAYLPNEYFSDHLHYYDSISQFRGKFIGFLGNKKYLLEGAHPKELTFTDMIDFTNYGYNSSSFFPVKQNNWKIINSDLEEYASFDGMIPIEIRQIEDLGGGIEINGYFICNGCNFSYRKHKEKIDYNNRIIVYKDPTDPYTWYDSLNINGDPVYQFMDGINFSMNGGKYGFISSSGDVKLKTEFDELTLLNNSQMNAIYGGNFSFTQSLGSLNDKEIPNRYFIAGIIATKNNKKQLFDLDGNLLIDGEFDQISVDSLNGQKLLKTKAGNKINYYNQQFKLLPITDLKNCFFINNFLVINSNPKASKLEIIVPADSVFYYPTTLNSFSKKSQLSLINKYSLEPIVPPLCEKIILAGQNNFNYFQIDLNSFNKTINPNEVFIEYIYYKLNKKWYMITFERYEDKFMEPKPIEDPTK